MIFLVATGKTMKIFSMIGKELIPLSSSHLYRIIKWFHLHGNIFLLELLYLLFISSLGYFLLQSLDGRTTTLVPRNLDLFFTSVSAVTASSLSTVEMESFSNTQLVIFIILMLLGGEVFISTVVHYIRTFILSVSPIDHCNIVDPSTCYQNKSCNFSDKFELSNIKIHEFGNSKSENFSNGTDKCMEDLRYKSLKVLGVVVLFYQVFVQLLGFISVLIYLNLISSAKNILKQKGLHTLIFSIFTVVSTFANCGFVPTNENMLIFRKNSGLLLILIPQALLGNTLYPSALRLWIWAVGRFVKKSEAEYLLNNSKTTGYHHLHSSLHSFLLLITVLVFITVQAALFSSMEWNSESLRGLNVYQKHVGILFQMVNTRHAGESIVDLSTITGAVLVLFVIMMYLPPYISFLPVENNSEEGNKRGRKIMDNFIFSQQTYLVIFIIVVCITERKEMVNDPLNFNVSNIAIEVISAYGNVGLSTGYNCDRRLKQDGVCQNKWYGFSGRWSDKGKIVLIGVMIFGKLKKFNLNGGKAWKVL